MTEVNTPLGTIYATAMNDPDYPGIYVYLKTENKNPVLLSVVECNNHPYKETNPIIQVLSYYNLTQDEPCHEGYVYPEDIENSQRA